MPVDCLGPMVPKSVQKSVQKSVHLRERTAARGSPTATAAAYCGLIATSETTHRLASAASGRVAINARFSFTSIETSNWCSGRESPSPLALIYASLRVQHRKNAGRDSSAESLPKVWRSLVEKNR